MRGYGTESGFEGSSKWMLVNQLVRDQKLAVLALQEAHLDDRRAARLNDIFGRNMTVYHSPDPTNSTGARGVAFAVNKRVLRDSAVTMRVVIPGRAALMSIQWSEDRTLKLLNVYAPNDAPANADFWKELENANLGRVDFMLGDCNVVEDKADRLPPREDPEAPREALQDLCTKLSIVDGWRGANPLDKGFTYLQESTAAQSRLDRIYVRRPMMKDCSEWCIVEPGIPTDHLMVAVAVENYKAPFIGKGRWVWPVHLLEDEEMKKTMLALAANLTRKIGCMTERTQEDNPQTAYAAFKHELAAAARARAKQKIPKMQK
ncbi:DNase I-like protein [Trametes versicolor FP-101664 SS1]|uniref:DNase I-like protein n=1 Tax=Trametes versicolor (strain FP-101664) TaxID=717944 RepID=UPI0004622852|nr:DNase I-like protein [Trametes versicolor FP-101664 SS1]EIW60553.1 DNase I-like protein [Trametes versicolor FP-101664 SS1]